MPVRVVTRPEVLPICSFVSYLFFCVCISWDVVQAYQDHAGKVEQESDGGVENENRPSDIHKILHLEPRNLNHTRHHEIHGRTRRRIVIQPHERIHLQPLTAQHNLNEHHPHGLEQDTRKLEPEPQPRELDGAGTGQRDAHDDDADVGDGGPRGAGDAQQPRDEEHGGRGRGLEHLDEGDGEVHVDDVGADEGDGGDEADGQDGAQVEAAGDGEGVARVEEGGCAGEELGDEGGEGEVPAGEDDGCLC